MQLLVVAQVEVVSAADWPRAVVWFVEVSAPTARFGTGALAIATLAAAATLVGRRGPGRAAAAGVVASSWLAWGLAQGPTDRLLALGPLCPEVVPAAAPPADSPSEDVTNQ